MVSKTPEIHSRCHRYTPFAYRSTFVNCRLGGDMNETRFRFLCNGPYLSCLLDPVPPRIDYSHCPLNRVLGPHTFFLTQNPSTWAAAGIKSPTKKAKKGLKRTKIMSKRCQNDPQVTPKWPQSDPQCPKSSQNGPILVPRWPCVAPKSLKKWSKRGSKVAKNRSKILQTFMKLHKNTQIQNKGWF